MSEPDPPMYDRAPSVPESTDGGPAPAAVPESGAIARSGDDRSAGDAGGERSESPASRSDPVARGAVESAGSETEAARPSEEQRVRCSFFLGYRLLPSWRFR